MVFTIPFTYWRCIYTFFFFFWWLQFQDKAPYVAKAEKRKSDYTRNMQAYNNKLVIICFIFEVILKLYSLNVAVIFQNIYNYDLVMYIFFNNRLVWPMLMKMNLTSPNLKWMMRMMIRKKAARLYSLELDFLWEVPNHYICD